MGKQTSKMPPLYKGYDPEMREWVNNLIQFLNHEFLILSGQIKEIEEQLVDIEARMAAHGI